MTTHPIIDHCHTICISEQLVTILLKQQFTSVSLYNSIVSNTHLCILSISSTNDESIPSFNELLIKTFDWKLSEPFNEANIVFCIIGISKATPVQCSILEPHLSQGSISETHIVPDDESDSASAEGPLLGGSIIGPLYSGLDS